ncbi:MAG: NYN domain-containing protein [Deltaproteobacteria bacterium]|nr:NYN domain-containing protein [Deltaproteobacteria bacterium]
MPLHLVVDGYNLIRRSPSLSILDRQDLEKGREELIRRLASYKRARSLPITVVFDGWDQGTLSGSSKMEKGIRVIFSPRGRKADQVIIQRAREMGEKAIVVTSDRGIRAEVERCHATVIGSEEFEIKMEMAFHMDLEEAEPPFPHVPPEPRGTRKKGPSRRLPRHMRRLKRRTNRL